MVCLEGDCELQKNSSLKRKNGVFHVGICGNQYRKSYNFTCWTFCLNINLDPPVVAADVRQLAMLAAHIAKTMRRLTNAQRRGQATVAKAEAARGQTTINQKLAAMMFKILV